VAAVSTNEIDFQALFGNLPSAYLVMDRDLVIVEVNPAYERMLARHRDELLGRYVFDAFPPSPDVLDEHGVNPVQLSFERARDTGIADVMPLQEYDILDPATGEVAKRYWSSVSSPVADEHGRTVLVLQRVDDVTEYVKAQQAAANDEEAANVSRRLEVVEAELFTRMRQLRAAQDAAAKAAEALRVSEQRTRAVLDTAVDGIMTIDGEGRIDSFNRAAESMFGYSAEEVLGRNVSMLMPEPYRSEHDGYLDRYRHGGDARIIGIGREVAGRRRDGSTFPLELSVTEVGTDRNAFAGVVRDITDRKRLEAELVQQALYDPLTGLANRRLLLERLELAVVRRSRHSGALALVYVDLDRFKLVNDSLGHEAGDELLARTAERLQSLVRPEDLVARLGGDEFVVLCDDLPDPDEAESVARRIVTALSVPVRLRGEDTFVSASVGVISDTGTRTASQLLADADAAMYRAKKQGGARFSAFEDAARPESDRLSLGNDLHRALDRDQFRPRYQPVIDLTTGDVLAAEALIRWQHPGRGELSPGAFLDLAQELGLIIDLDTWMLTRACLDAADWRRTVGRQVSVWVNLSGRSLAHNRLQETISAVLDHAGLDPSLLTLEITEGTLMENAPATAATLEELKSLGVQLAIDDFGTGYSSLAYLQQFPVHALKVDRSFVDRLDKEPQKADASAAIVKAVVNLALALGLRTIAEGIETPEQLTAVTELGCDLGQGYFLGRPAPHHHVTTAMRSGIMFPAMP
jgi:diguanylate cyclase (GGDEF)-like protein/PAS domain S-box-containing protein